MAEKAIERYDLTFRLVDGGARAEMQLRESGEWMRYDAELVRDAMRYRWLRTCTWDEELKLRAGDELRTGTHLDTAIDTAIAQAEGGEV